MTRLLVQPWRTGRQGAIPAVGAEQTNVVRDGSTDFMVALISERLLVEYLTFSLDGEDARTAVRFSNLLG